MSKKIISIVFLAIIFITGLLTIADMKTDLRDNLKTIDENIKFKNTWIDINGLFHRCIGSRYIKDPGDTDVYMLDNSSISYTLEKTDTSGFVENVEEFSNFVSELYGDEVPFTYIQLPYKIQCNQDLPAGGREYGNDNADRLIAGLKSKGIDTYDLRPEIEALLKQKNLEYKDLFYTTDHHWTPQTAMWAAGKISAYLHRKQRLAFESECFDVKNYEVKTLDNWFLGSLGKRSGVLYAGADDFDIITPKEPTNFTFYAESKSKKIHRKGEFSETLMYSPYYEEKDYYRLNPYAAYIGGDYAINEVTNIFADNDDSILLFRDSYSCAMEPFLCMNYKKVTAIDLRHYSKKKLKKYLEHSSFDAVIIAYNPSAITEEQFDFGGLK